MGENEDILRAVVDALEDCANDLEAEIKARAIGELPRRIERDLQPVVRARELIARAEAALAQ